MDAKKCRVIYRVLGLTSIEGHRAYRRVLRCRSLRLPWSTGVQRPLPQSTPLRIFACSGSYLETSLSNRHNSRPSQNIRLLAPKGRALG